jgi:hypothetical protein
MTKWAAAVAFALLSMATSVRAQPWGPSPLIAELAGKDVLSEDDLVALTNIAQVDPSLDLTPLIGKPFRVELTPDPTIAEGPHWWYDSQHQALSLHAPIGRLSGRYFALRGCSGEATSARGIEIFRSGASREVAGQTSSGDARMFDSVEQHRVSLGGLVCGKPAPASGLNTDVNEDGRRAHEQLNSLQATIEGVLQPVDGESVVACAGEQIAATTADPTQLVVHQCVVGAAIRRITFTANGVELAYRDAVRSDSADHRKHWLHAPHLPRMPALPPLPRL